jgi:hypothetical protein
VLAHEEFFGQNGAVCAHMWWDLCRLDIAATYQIDSMMDTNCRYLTEGTMPFDLDGPTSTMLHLKAVQETQRAIEDPTRCYGTGLVAGITASIFAAVSRRIAIVPRSFFPCLRHDTVRSRRRLRLFAPSTRVTYHHLQSTRWSIIAV